MSEGESEPIILVTLRGVDRVDEDDDELYDDAVNNLEIDYETILGRAIDESDRLNASHIQAEYFDPANESLPQTE